MSFLTDLKIELLEGRDDLWRLLAPLVYKSKLLDTFILIPTGFETDLASVPRVPIVYWFWGGRVHREAVLHDYLFRINSVPVVSFKEANQAFLEAAKSRHKHWLIRYPMYWGVCIGGKSSYHKKKVLPGSKFEKFIAT